MSNNLLIVESHNDAFFIERLKNFSSSDNNSEQTPVSIKYRSLDGIDNLKSELKAMKREIQKGNFNKIGIITDADRLGIAGRLAFINESLKSITTDLEILESNIWYKSEELNAEFSCHVVNIDGFGELENLLKEIKIKPSPFADCLHSWRNCLEKNNQFMSDKEFYKFWIYVYGRYDCCSKKEKKRAGENCNEEISLKEKELWDFSHPVLNDLKSYLSSFIS